MNYEHDNEFGQRRGINRRDPSMREDMQYGQRGDIPRNAYPPGTRRPVPRRNGGNPQMREGNFEDRAIRRSDAPMGMEGTGRTAPVPGRTGRVQGADGERLRAARRETAAGREQGMGRPPGSRAAAPAGGSARPRKAADSSAGSLSRAGTIPSPDVTARESSAQAIRKAKQKKLRRRIIAAIVAECFALMLIFTYGYFARRLTLIQKEEFDPQEVGNSEISLDTIKKMKGYRMIAIFGVDSRDSNVGAGAQSDVIIICGINEDTGEIKLASVYRDTYLNINDEGSYRKVNAAYTNGGPQQALKALNKNLDLNITEYVTFSWKAVAEGINILGGVDLEITKSEFKFINGFITETVKATGVGSYQLKSPGMQHLDGIQAVAYGRLRLMDTDYARTERQRKIIELAFAKAKQADYSVLNNILVVVLPNVSTNITFADMTTMALGISKYHIGDTAGFPFAKGNANIPGKGDCVIPQTLESNVKQLHTFLFGDEDYETTDQVKQISSKIAADSGMYKEGTPFKGSALSTDGYVPEESTRAEVREKETTAEETDETDESRTSSILWETDVYGNTIAVPGETDEHGQLIDAPIEDWPDEDPVQPNGSGTNSPVHPGYTQEPGGTGTGNGPAGGNTQWQDPRLPGTNNQGGTGPGTSTDPSGSGGTGTVPGGNGAAGPGDSSISDGREGFTTPADPTTPAGPDATTPTMSWEAGPGMVTPNNDNTFSAENPAAGGWGEVQEPVQ